MPFAPTHVFEQLLAAPATTQERDGNETVTTADSSQVSGYIAASASSSENNGDEARAHLVRDVTGSSSAGAVEIFPTPPNSDSDSSARSSSSAEGRSDDGASGAPAADDDAAAAMVHANLDFVAESSSLDGSALTEDSAEPAEMLQGATSPPSSVSSTAPNSDALSLSFRPSMVGSSVALPDASIESSNRAETSSSSEQGETFSEPSTSPLPGNEREEKISADARDEKRPNARSHPRLISPQPCNSPQHDSASYVNVGNILLRSSNTDDIPPNSCPPLSGLAQSGSQTRLGGLWWSTMSERNWDELAEAARSVLDSIEEFSDEGREEEGGDRHGLLLAVPPRPPDLARNNHGAGRGSSIEDKTKASILGLLPREFICPLCKDAIVGAVLLDCGCPLSVFCAHCIEGGRGLLPQGACGDIVEDDDFVIVERNPEASAGGDIGPSKEEFCPSCRKVGVRMVPCHALDVAIVNSVVNLSALQRPMRPETELRRDDITAFQSLYYSRLSWWRGEVLRRHEIQSAESNRKREEALAMLIQAEEEIIWNKKKRRGRWRSHKHGRQVSADRRGLVIIGEVVLVLAAAAAAAMLGSNISVRR